MSRKKRVFVFPSNEAGIHGAGAALQAKLNWGAQEGVGVGPTGNAYAIPTKDTRLHRLPLSRIRVYVDRFLRYAEWHHGTIFILSAIGCGKAGYRPEEVAPLFEKTTSNVKLPEEFALPLHRRAVARREMRGRA